MNYDFDSIENKLNKITKESQKLEKEFIKTVHNISEKDITQETNTLKYSLYEGKEKEYQILNDKYKELISGFSEAYLSMSDFYVGPELPREYVFNNDKYLDNIPELYSLYIYYAMFEIFLKYTLNEYEVD